MALMATFKTLLTPTHSVKVEHWHALRQLLADDKFEPRLRLEVSMGIMAHDRKLIARGFPCPTSLAVWIHSRDELRKPVYVVKNKYHRAYHLCAYGCQPHQPFPCSCVPFFTLCTQSGDASVPLDFTSHTLLARRPYQKVDIQYAAQGERSLLCLADVQRSPSNILNRLPISCTKGQCHPHALVVHLFACNSGILTHTPMCVKIALSSEMLGVTTLALNHLQVYNWEELCHNVTAACTSDSRSAMPRCGLHSVNFTWSN